MKKNYFNIIVTSIAIFSFLFLLTLALDQGALENYQGEKLTFAYPRTWQLSMEDLTSHQVSSVAADTSYNPVKPFTDNEELIKFNLPVGWLITQENFVVTEILKHVRVVSPDHKNICIMEIWQAYKPLEVFIEDIKTAPFSGQEAENFSVQEHEVKKYKGYLVTYKINNIFCKEFYFEEDQSFYRIGYFYSGLKWTQEQEKNFTTIIQSFTILRN